MALPRDAMEASRTGAPLRAKNPGEVQVAGGVGSAIMRIISAVSGPEANKAFKSLPDAGVATDKIPTPIEERLLPKGEYERRQARLAQDRLTPEGNQRFNEAGRSAKQAIAPDPTLQAAQDALPTDEVEGVVEGAQEGLRGIDPETMTPRGTVASVEPTVSEADAADALRLTEETRVNDFVRSGSEGIDFNFENLETGDDVKALINVVSEIFEDPIKASKRGVVANKETLVEAETLLSDELGLTRRLLKRKEGELLNASEMTAVRHLLVRSSERLVGMAAAIRAGDDGTETLVTFRRQMAIHAGILMQAKGAQTEIARALQSFNIPAGANTPESTQELLKAMINEAGGRAQTIRMADGLLDVHKTGGSQQVHKYALGGWLDKADGVFQEIYVNGLLSWVPTHVKNLVATPLFMGYMLPEEILAGLIGNVERSVLRAVGKPTDDGVYAGQALARAFGLSQSVRDAWRTAKVTWDTELSADVVNKVEGAQFQKITKENLTGTGMAGQFFDALGMVVNYDKVGRVVRAPGRALMGADDLWRVFAQRGELYAEAYAEQRRALARGLSPDEAMDNMQMAILDPRSYANQLDEASRYVTLTTELPGIVSKGAQGIKRFPFFGTMILPFSTAPTNAILRALERLVPTGILSDPVKRQKSMARVALAWGGTYALYTYALEGRMTGAYPRGKADTLPPGWKPWSFVFRGDNWPVDADGDKLPLYDPQTGAPNGALTYVSYAGIEPIGALMGIAADVAQRMRRARTNQEREDIVANSLAASSQYFIDMPMLKSLSDIQDTLERGDISILGRSPVSGALPFSSAVRNVEGLFDSTSRKASGRREYFTRADIEAMGVDEETGELKTYLIGTPKNKKFSDSMAKFRSMFSDRPIFGGSDDDTSGVQYDILGRERSKGVRFDVNPVVAIYNLMMPFDISFGEEPHPVALAHMELDYPLRSNKEEDNGMRFTEAFQARWAYQSKNVVEIARKGVPMKFLPAMQHLLDSREFYAPRNESPEQEKRRKRSQMVNLEDQFYDQGLQAVLNMPEYADEAQAYQDNLDEKQRIGLGQ
jgi:hypothetical protein